MTLPDSVELRLNVAQQRLEAARVDTPDCILAVMRSNVARDVSRRREERLAALTPAERVALAMRLGEAGLASFMTTHSVNRDTARARIAATRRAGRRRSAAAG